MSSNNDEFKKYVSEESQEQIDFVEKFVSGGWGVSGMEGSATNSMFAVSSGSISMRTEEGGLVQLFGGSREMRADPEDGVSGGADGLLYHSNIRLIDEYDLLNLDIDQLRILGKYLTDVIMKPQTRIGGFGPDHLAYWAWTTDFAYYTLLEKQEKTEYRGILLDFETLIDFVILSFQNSMNTQVPTSLMTSGLRFAGGAGFPILEGLVRRRCDEISLDGSVNFESDDKKLEIPGRRGSISNDRDRPLQLDHILHIWMNSGASTRVQELLEDIDTGYGPGQIGMKFPDANTDKFSEGYFRVLFDLRNYNLHGEGSTQTVGAILLNLCCLLLWDAITETEFFDARSDFDSREAPKAMSHRLMRLMRTL
ncbi:hypothetical protein ACFR99_06005 [Haloarchaeobius amylolyticus]|uniref:ApeA N-terminal domain-containing protein n=1 Tax=Haloarchaeobius amylolyticus TaxID=1198296 RepID=A0ABD6BEU4_9EURY